MGPTDVYKERLGSWQNRLERIKRGHRQLGVARLFGVAAALCLLWWIEIRAPSMTWPVAGLCTAGFLLTSSILSRREGAIRFAEQAISFYAPPVLGENRKAGPGRMGKDLDLDDDHAFARDLDIAAPGGLFERLNLASTREGMQELLRTLTTATDAETIAERQAAVRELKPQLDFRERLYVTGSQRLRYVRTEHMLSWASAEPSRVPTWMKSVCFGLGCAAIALAALSAVNPTPGALGALTTCLVAELAVWRVAGLRLRLPAIKTDYLHRDFSELHGLLKILEEHPVDCALLQRLCGDLASDAGSASSLLGELCRLVQLHEAKRNQFVAIFGPLVLYGTQVSLALERWRAAHGAKLQPWISTVAQFEALSSLGCFAYEHPATVFPQLESSDPVFRAEAVAHPLLPNEAVANDFELGGENNVMFVSGANMAGKSTLLRTIGATLALAYAGAPVRARSISMAPMSMIASIRVTDSLERGESRFSAELKRIRLMLASIRQRKPTLILIDELFGGTNSFDRCAGAVALAEFLVRHDNALAVLSTHDRKVTEWAERRGNGIANVHFRDVFVDGEMTYDYRLAPGPASRGNAMELIKAAGVPVIAETGAAGLEAAS